MALLAVTGVGGQSQEDGANFAHRLKTAHPHLSELRRGKKGKLSALICSLLIWYMEV